MRYYSSDEIAAAVRQLYKGKTQKQLAKQLDISQTYLCHIMQGKIPAGPAVLKALGFGERPFYRKLRAGKSQHAR